MIKKKEGKLVSQLNLNKLKKEARLGGNDENKSLSECKNEWLNHQNNGKNLRRKKRNAENELLESHSVELPEGNEKERKKKKKVLQSIKKNMNRDRYFKCITQNVGKGKRVEFKGV